MGCLLQCSLNNCCIRITSYNVCYTKLLRFSLSAIVVLAITSPYRNMTINIMQAGARGDGIRDDSAVFIRALHQAAGRKGSTRIIVPAGTYLLNVKEPLELSSNTRLIGEDKPVLKFIAQPSEAFGYEAIRISGRDVLVDGIDLDGSGSVITSYSIHYTKLYDVYNHRHSSSHPLDEGRHHTVLAGSMLTHSIYIRIAKDSIIKMILIRE